MVFDFNDEFINVWIDRDIPFTNACGFDTTNSTFAAFNENEEDEGIEIPRLLFNNVIPVVVRRRLGNEYAMDDSIHNASSNAATPRQLILMVQTTNGSIVDKYDDDQRSKIVHVETAQDD